MISPKFSELIVSKRILLIIGIFYLFYPGISAKRVYLLDTTELPTLQWTTFTASENSEDGWLEESYPNVQEGVNWRTYVVCDVRKDYVNNWIRTPFIERGDANRISVEVRFAMRDCKKFPYTARTCKETFALLAYEADADFATREQPYWTDVGINGYKRIDRLTAVGGRFSDKENVALNVEIRHFPASRRGFYLGFRDEGACVSLIAVKVYYEVCEETLINFSIFPETAVGSNLTTIREVRGRCVDNASPPAGSNIPKYFCKGDGSWDLLTGGCQCNAGYFADGGQCLPCDVGFYKDTPGISGCVVCPANSESKSASTWCECKKGYHRLPFDSKSSPCIIIPVHAPVTNMDQTQPTISWASLPELGNVTEEVKEESSEIVNGISKSYLQTPGVISGIVVGGVLFFGLIILSIMLLWKRCEPCCCSTEKRPMNYDVSKCTKDSRKVMHCHHPGLNFSQGNSFSARGVFCPLEPTLSLFGSSSSRHYVDPLTYEDPNQLLNEFTNEIDPNCITIEELLDEGEFGKVCKGRLEVWDGYIPTREIVAIKTLKLGASEESKKDFLMEASIMCQFHHPKIVVLKGVVLRKEPVMIVTEYVVNGKLNRYLNIHKSRLDIEDLVKMVRDVACGMAYLREMKFVHRDLAARNILVDASRNCKISDFGLSRLLKETSSEYEQIYMSTGGKIPVRWTAPEALSYRKFSYASDVWSFGIVMWEVMSYGQRPYGQWENGDVVVNVEKGYRLEMPKGCPEPIYELMQDCWKEDRTSRPIISVVLQRLENFLVYPESLRRMTNGNRQTSMPYHSLSLAPALPAMQPPTSGLNQRPSSGTSSGFVSISGGNVNAYLPISESEQLLSNRSISDFFCELDMSDLVALFQNTNHRTVADLERLRDMDFFHLGIPATYHKRIRDAICNLRSQYYASTTKTLPGQCRIYPNVQKSIMAAPPPPPPPPRPSLASGTLGRRLPSTNIMDGPNLV